jgi:hypothetical protein
MKLTREVVEVGEEAVVAVTIAGLLDGSFSSN